MAIVQALADNLSDIFARETFRLRAASDASMKSHNAIGR
jgi:hypothetical protein